MNTSASGPGSPDDPCEPGKRRSIGSGASGAHSSDADGGRPRLCRQGNAVQLVVDGRPMLIRGGEIGNSTATNPACLEPFWPGFTALNLNTLLVPVYWHLIEPAEGEFDFATVDQVIAQARRNGMRLVLLWFGSWKNSMSCYAPEWVKRDPARFPRAADSRGELQEILSPFAAENRNADARAFATLMKQLRETDAERHTVVMVQVENEIGMIPSARDHSEPANRAFSSSVPEALMTHLGTHREKITPELRAAWQGAGGRDSGTWGDVFGSGPAGQEIFMAWHFGQYTEAVAAAGKAEYPLPLFVNAALIRPGHQPGQYPSAGPLPHLFDVWKAAAPHIDFFSPDIYFQNFVAWARRYHLPDNPLFIPEALRAPEASVHALYSFGAHDAIGFCPFGIESIGDTAGELLAGSYDLVRQLEPLLVVHQGKGRMAGLLPEGPEQRLPQRVVLGDCVIEVTFERETPPPLADGVIVPTAAAPTPPKPSGGLIIATGTDEYVIAGLSLILTFSPKEGPGKVGLLSVEEGRYEKGRWENNRWLSGDETHQGRHVRLVPGRFSIQRVRLYRY